MRQIDWMDVMGVVLMSSIVGGLLAVSFDATYVGFGLSQAIASFVSGMILVLIADVVGILLVYQYYKG